MLQRRRSNIFATTLVVAVALVGLARCTEAPVQVDGLYLQATSEAPLDGSTIDRLRVLLYNDAARWPANANGDEALIDLGDRDPAATPVLVKLEYGGATFAAGTTVNARVIGLAGMRAVSQWQGTLDLTARKLQKISLTALLDACDVDGDTFFDCSVAGCCDGGDALNDCAPDDDTAHPWATEPTCEPCDDMVDQDCAGGDLPCVDEDGDKIADCIEAQAGCGTGDPKVGPGLPELCDGRDNNCDGTIDEGFTLPGTLLTIGQSCGEPNSPCANGIVVCGAVEPFCTSDSAKLGEDICNNGIDDDCDGIVDQGCEETDLDGDTYLGDDDCNDYDTAFHKDAVEPCCPAQLAAGVDPENPSEDIKALCDFNCDDTVGFCAVDDLDGDGFSPPADCDDDDPYTYPGAIDVCGDGKDNDCFGGDVPCDQVEDADGDGYPDEVDCAPNDPYTHPQAAEACDGIDNDCDGQTDEGNPGGGAVCGIDVGECEKGINVCAKTPQGSQTKCVGAIPPASQELCDGLDNNCDGNTDENLNYKGIPNGAPCDGVGACGVGTVECGPQGFMTCSTNPDGSESEVQPEVCDTLDNNCDGLVNESLTDVSKSTCKTAGVCGAPEATVTASCKADGTWACDYSLVPGYQAAGEALCDGIDEDCDGLVDEDFGVGTGCDGPDVDNCDNGTFKCDPSAGPTAVFCEELGAAVEICDGLDNNCNGQVDEGFDLGAACDGPDIDFCTHGVVVCAADGSGTQCGLESLENIAETCDGIDNDCDGATDEGFQVVGNPCDDPAELGDFCANGTYACAATGLGIVCVGDSPVPEVCDGVDNDCDGLVDEDATELGMPCDGGDDDACMGGVWECPSDGSNTVLACTDDPTSIVEECNNIDDDCDGSIDEELSAAGSIAGCTTAGVCGSAVINAVCTAGEWLCDYGAVVDYLAVEQGSATGCDGLDNDCDGVVDEGFPDGDFDTIADCVDPDLDGDSIEDNENGLGVGFSCAAGQTAGCDDNCPLIPNGDQSDGDNDGIGDVCDGDRDGDTISNGADNCPDVANQQQEDADNDGVGDACETPCNPQEVFCDPDGRTLQTCASDGSGPDPVQAQTCSFICHNDACVSATNVSTSAVAGCGSSAPNLVVPFGVTAQINDSYLWCPSCLGLGQDWLDVDSNSGSYARYCLGSLVVQAGGVLRTDNYYDVTWAKPLVIVVDGDVTVAGTIDVDGRTVAGSTGGAGGNGGGKGGNRCSGDGCTGLEGVGTGRGRGGGGDGGWWGEGGGGAGASFGGKGGNGGDTESGGPGIARDPYGNSSITPLQAGSGGGGGGRQDTSNNHGAAGGGGGALQFIVRGLFTLASGGIVSSSGGQGGNGSSRGGAGGGGSGGALLIECRLYQHSGGTMLVPGGNGGSAAAGGGGVGATSGINGGNGSSNTSGGEGGAGGGGGAGRVRIQATSGQTCTAVSPSGTCSAGLL